MGQSKLQKNCLVETKKVYFKEKYVVIEYCVIWLYEINISGHKRQDGPLS